MNNKFQHNRPSLLIHVVERLMSLFVVFPLTILHWRGSWQLLDVYLDPADEETSWWICFGVGANLGLIALLLKPFVASWLDTAGDNNVFRAESVSAAFTSTSKSSQSIFRTVATRVQAYVHGWILMCYWRGLWSLLDYYLTTDRFNSLLVYAVCQLILIATRSVRTAGGVPISIQLDSDETLLDSELVFNSSPNDLLRFVLDCLLTQNVVVFSTIGVWRGIWNVLDATIYPHFRLWSDVVCLVAGTCLLSLLYATELIASSISARLDQRPICRLIYEDLLFVFAVWSNLILWRGASNLCIYFLLPPETEETAEAGAWLTHLTGSIGLMALRLFNNVGLHGIERDGVYERGEGIYCIKFLQQLIESTSSCCGDKLLQEKDEREKQSLMVSMNRFSSFTVTETKVQSRMDQQNTYVH